MPKYGLLTSAIRPLPKQIKEFKRAGFDYVEVGIEEPLGIPELLIKQNKQIKSLIRKEGMFALGHTTYWVDFGSSHNEVRRGWVKEAKHMIDAAQSLDIKYLNFHFNGGKGQTTQTKEAKDIFLRNFTDSIVELSAYARSRGVTLMLENTPPREVGKLGIDDFSYVIRNAPGLMVHFDIAHAFLDGGMQGINRYIERFSSKIVHLHIHDNKGVHDDHLPLGEGKIDFSRVVKSLKAIDYDRTITFEVFKSTKAAAKSRDLLIKLWSKG